jgi:hypothetical protein
MTTAVQPTNIHPVASINFFKENNLKKQKFMKDRFPLLKGLVYRVIQNRSFTAKVKLFISTVEQARDISKAEAVLKSKELFTYLYNTRDIWVSKDRFSTTVKEKIIELTKEEPSFKTYLLQLGYSCPYLKRNKEICGKELEVDTKLCKTHSKCQHRLRSRILLSLPSLPTDLSNIVFHYSIPYSRLR